MNFTKRRTGVSNGKWIFAALLTMIFIFVGSESYSQIDSRNQIRPDKEKNFDDPEKPTKRLKSKKNPRFKGKKAYSNKKQIKRSRRARARQVDRSPKGDISGRKVETKRTPRRTEARPQPDPYKNRRIRTEKARAGTPVSEPRTATKKGERARTGDISGQSRVRQRSVKTASRPSYAQPNPYVGRKIRTEKSRAKSNKREIRSVRSATKPSESRKPNSRPRAVSATAAPKVKTKRNVYRNHERKGGEKSTDKDIAGRKIRTKNTRSSGQDAGTRVYSNVSPYTGRSKSKEGGRFESTRRPSAPRSATRPAESSSYGKSNLYATRKNSRSRTFTGAKKAKKVRSVSQPSRKGEKTIYGGKYNAGSVRSVSGYSQARSRKGPGTPVTLSGNRKRYKQKNTYQGKDRHFGENSSTKDIAGRNLRTRNYKSYNPTYGAAGFTQYQKGGKKSKGYPSTSPRSGNRAGWNNGGSPIVGKGINANSEAISGYRGKMRASGVPRYGRGGESVYSGKTKAKTVRKYSGGQGSLFTGRRRAEKPIKGGGSITKGWNNGGSPIIGKGINANSEAISNYSGRLRASGSPKFGRGREGEYSGRMRASQPPKGGGGSITRHWNNSGLPLNPKGRNGNSVAISSYSGKMRASGMPRYSRSRESAYAGNMKAKKPFKGAGGSITRHWNNKGEPLSGQGRNAKNEASSNYQGKMSLNAMPSYSKGQEGVYAGNRKAKKPLKGGGGSITRHWNNKGEPLSGHGRYAKNEAISNYQGKMRLNAMPSYGKGDEGVYSGDRKAKKPPKGGGGSITTHWNNKGEPIEGMGINGTDKDILAYQGKNKAPEKIKQSEGTERGRTKSLSFVRIGDPTHMGLQKEAHNKKVNNSLPKELSRKERLRMREADGLDNGKSRTFTFWAVGDPTQGGLVRTPSQAKGRLHPSAAYTSGKSRNSIEEKEQPVKIKIWWAKLFKKNANQPDSVKEKPRRPRYDKGERSIWETAEREDWYNN